MMISIIIPAYNRAHLDSDDELTPGALTTFMSIAGMDSSLNAITCNCIDAVTRSFTGKGFEHDQYLLPGQIFKDGRGEFWDLTKTELLQERRSNEKVVSWEAILWFMLEKNARRYYVHKALRVYHTEDSDRISKLAGNTPSDKEREYLKSSLPVYCLLKEASETLPVSVQRDC